MIGSKPALNTREYMYSVSAAAAPAQASASSLTTSIDPPALPVYTYDQIANQLTHAYWGGSSHRFAVSADGAITVNLTALNAVGQLLAREALNTWADVIGVRFVEVLTGGQIIFDDEDDGSNPHANAIWSGGITSEATINVPRGWLVTYGTTLDSYSFQTYLHEIGHALGLGHAGDYNNDATYEVDASFQNDSWATTIMSYFDQTESTYFANQGFTRSGLGTPMNGDVVAVQNLYGASATTRIGDTIYGYNSTADRVIFDASQFTTLAYTIVDSGGVDTLDYSLSAASQVINLNAEQFSSVLGRVGNVMIARGVTIENAIGGSGNDTITGNGAVNFLRGGAGDDLLDAGSGSDRLDGGAGADRMYGGAGNDTYFVDSASDAVYESVDAGNDIVFATASHTLRGNVERLTLSGTASINGRGNALANLIVGNSGANILDGGLGADTMDGAGGDDTYFVDDAGDVVTEGSAAGTDTVRAAITYRLGTNVENLLLTGTAAIDGFGNAVANIITGNAGANRLNGGLGGDSMRGGDGNDTYYIDDAGDRAIESSATGGTDTVRSSVNFVLGSNVENLVLLGSATRGTGNGLANVIDGTAAADLLDGRAGADTMRGGAGNDTYYVDNTGDLAVETSAADGIDIVRSSVSFALGNYLETLVLTGSGAIDGTGNELDNTINGNAGANVLDGGAGADVLRGGLGNDTYVIDNAGDRVIESYLSYGDQVLSSVTYRLGTNLVRLVLTGTGAINGTGNELENTLIGNNAANILNGLGGADLMEGGAGDDTYYVDNASDFIRESSIDGDNDTIRASVTYSIGGAYVETLILVGAAAINGTGNSLANRIIGNSSANVLDGNAGADRLQGLAGDDTYFVDDAGDVVIEQSGGGTDTVRSAIDYVLGANLESLTLLEYTLATRATGNSLSNTLVGNNSNNILDGRAGADTMSGGGGSDIYIVDHAGDVVIEIAGDQDEVHASISYVLSDPIERLQLTGTAAINGTGNALGNTLFGNSAANILNGLGGSDAMLGGAGNDTYYVDNLNDGITEYVGEGIDTVYSSSTHYLSSSVENLNLIGVGNVTGRGNELDNRIVGNSGNNSLGGLNGDDILEGGNGDDRLDGHSGNDRMTGGAGSDTFEIGADVSPQNIDVITDFSAADLIILTRPSANLPIGALTEAQFYIGSTAHDEDDRIIYDSATGNLYFDIDGNGSIAQELFAQVSPGLAISHLDFILV